MRPAARRWVMGFVRLDTVVEMTMYPDLPAVGCDLKILQKALFDAFA